MTLTPELCHAARILARIDRSTLAAESGLSEDRIEEFENGTAELGDNSAEKLKSTLQALGVVLLPEEEAGGVGVRLKFTGSETRRILNWEGEGGRVNQDDVV
ncbi:XRE family transcriptional regulator [Martelella soudanensis]|uniref:XRE family transcriptional regulator n=1 Tax=unclassified Martelella TaxID=2629616 RepID=UPI0015E00379|nr:MULTISPECIES: XRE family transcriptional regulator [unclassified Martelella]